LAVLVDLALEQRFPKRYFSSGGLRVSPHLDSSLLLPLIEGDFGPGFPPLLPVLALFSPTPKVTLPNKGPPPEDHASFRPMKFFCFCGCVIVVLGTLRGVFLVGSSYKLTLAPLFPPPPVSVSVFFLTPRQTS